MKIGILKESGESENRVAVSPKVCSQWAKLGWNLFVETGAGEATSWKDSNYEDSGAKIFSRKEVFESCDIICGVNPLDLDSAKQLKENQLVVSLMFHRTNNELVEAVKAQKAQYLSLDAIPRISRAQSMDVLSSQANLGGYKAVILGANHMEKIFPMMMTAAGTITPAKILIFGVGVAGLQAIATAKRLGAVVEATDVRPETKEQVESLGGKFIEVKGVEVESEGGYAKEASDEYRAKQREAVNKSLANADLVITTAQVPGRKAPVLIDKEQLSLMKRGSVIVDMAAEQGGNCEGCVSGEIAEVGGVKIIGALNLPSTVSANASELFAKNIDSLLKLIIKEEKLHLDMEDEIVSQALIVGNNQSSATS